MIWTDQSTALLKLKAEGDKSDSFSIVGYS